MAIFCFLITVLALGKCTANGFPVLKECKKYLEEDWDTSKIEDYETEKGYHVKFDVSGKLKCYKWQKVVLAEVVPCQYIVVASRHNDDFENFTMSRGNCVDLFDRIAKSFNPYPYEHGHRVFRMNGKFYFFCFLLKDSKGAVFSYDCPSNISHYRINPKNFIYMIDGIRTYHPPTLSQYEHLAAIGHVSVDPDDYDYLHSNDYS